MCSGVTAFAYSLYIGCVTQLLVYFNIRLAFQGTYAFIAVCYRMQL